MKSKAFRYLWMGQAFANLGDILYVTALIAAIYTRTGSPLYMAFVPFIVTLAKFISSVIAPILMERCQLKALLFYSQGAKTFLLLVMFILLVMNPQQTVFLFILAFFISFLDGWALPAQNAMVPLLVKREELLGTNGFLSTVDHTIGIGGWSIGGLLTALIAPSGTLAAVFCLYVLSTLFMFRINIEPGYHKENVEARAKNYIKSMSDGWSTIWRDPALRTIHTLYWIESAASVVWIAAIMYVFVKEQLKTGEQWWGLINGAFFAGLILASFLVMKQHKRIAENRGPILLIGSIFIAVLTFLFGINELPILALIYSVLYGLFDQAKAVILQTAVQSMTSPEKLPKVYAAQNALVTITFGTASLLVGWFVQHFGVENAFLASSLLLAAAIVPSAVLAKKIKNQT
ncbi:MFS transporter [Falsibacillus pallidus]|uniref:Transmembrane secretion effector n=1 Tax=Falsibacillus pallidus TaxID=493781 RepID=A0A370GWK6_9BACI|nr:MFS transporter [Falsibacillus pallidus]RDI47931.1 transmembrane secretion effector [Falsibacillus pallidus]